jgi:hypothetical protein
LRRTIRLVLTCLLAAALTACEDDAVAPLPNVPSAPAVVRALPDAATLAVGSPLLVEVRIEKVADVGSVPFHLLYNEDRLDFEPPATEGTFLSSGGAATTFLVAEPAPGGDIIVGLSRMGTGAGASGSGLLATFRFRAVQAGRVPVTFSGASVKDPDAVNLPASFVGASVEIIP